MTLARTRFATSAVWETGASLTTLFRPHAHLLHARLRERMPRRPTFDVRLLAGVSRGPAGWTAAALLPAPTDGHLDPAEQLARVSGTPAEVAEADLAVLRAAYPDGSFDAWTPEEYADRLAAALGGYWQAVLAPVWDRVVAIEQADVAHHLQVVATDGLAAALAGLHPDVALEGGRLRLRGRASGHDVKARDEGVWLVPCVFRWPDVVVSADAAALGYGARGAGLVWDDTSRAAPALAGLVGRSRAAILSELDVPRTTTLLADRVDLTPPTVSAHLSVLVGAGLLTSQRAGRRVLYRRTPLGDRLVACSAGDQGELLVGRPG
jgi:DNA-binding transcriptional ArsR family regulator